MIDCELQVIGTGPAGIGLLLALCNRIAAAGGGDCPERRLLDGSVFFEACRSPGGQMGHYRINANTTMHDVVLGIGDDTPFVGVRDAFRTHPETQSRVLPLPLIGRLMVDPLGMRVQEYLGDRLVNNTRIETVEIRADGFDSYDRRGRLRARSAQILFCCGGDDRRLPEFEAYRDCWEGSARFLMREDLDGLPANRDPIVIVGGSHSAFSCAWRLQEDPLFSEFAADRDIVILHRRERFKLRASVEFARQHAIEFDPENDVCPDTGVVFFNGGLRKDAKQLYLDIRDGRETRVRLQPMNALADQHELLATAGLILQGTGFAHRMPTVLRDGEPVALGRPTRDGCLHDLETGAIVPCCFGMGLGFNVVPDRSPAGEPGFRGGVHGFQSYPLAIAPPIIERMLAATQHRSFRKSRSEYPGPRDRKAVHSELNE